MEALSAPTSMALTCRIEEPSQHQLPTLNSWFETKEVANCDGLFVAVRFISQHIRGRGTALMFRRFGIAQVRAEGARP